MHCEFGRSLCDRGSGLPAYHEILPRYCVAAGRVRGLSASSGRKTPRPIVRDIVVEYVGPPSISKARVIDNLATRIGQPYSERNAEADIRALYATGGVANVRIFAEPYLDGVRVTVLLQGRPVIQEIMIEGAEQIPLRRVRREVSSKVGEVLTEERLESDRQKILKIYEDRNYSEVDVQYRIEEIAGTNQVRVFFQISEGPRLVVRRINFFGNESVRKRDLIKVMKTRPWNLLSFFNKSGRLLPAQMEEDRSAIRTLYQNRGFADAEVTDVQTVPLEGTESS